MSPLLAPERTCSRDERGPPTGLVIDPVADFQKLICSTLVSTLLTGFEHLGAFSWLGSSSSLLASAKSPGQSASNTRKVSLASCQRSAQSSPWRPVLDSSGSLLRRGGSGRPMGCGRELAPAALGPSASIFSTSPPRRLGLPVSASFSWASSD